MQLGVHSATFVKDWQEDITPYIIKCKEAGYSCVEISLLGQNEKTAKKIYELSKELNIEITCTTGLSTNEDLTSISEKIRKNGEQKLLESINIASIMGSKILTGVIHCSWGVSDTKGSNKEIKFNNSANSLKKIGSHLEKKNIRLGIEPLNRYETDFINTVDEGLELCRLVNHPHIGLLLDVYHMNIEEKNMIESIKRASNKIFHFHVAENDRGIPGTGTLNFKEIFKTLISIGYNKNVTLEMFIQANQNTSKDLFTWRNIENDPFEAIKKSREYLQSFLND